MLKGEVLTERDLLRILSANIKLHRNRCRWSQAELAERINISINFLSDIETGKKWASPVTMVKLAKTFEIEVFELLKPLGFLPEDSRGMIERYTENIYDAIAEVQADYLARMEKEDQRNRAEA
jgi:transcriptional regulator with XRE-family HTH domain